MVAAMDAVGVDGAILVSPFSMYRYDASYALEVFAAHPGRFRLVKPVDPTDPAVVDTIIDWASTDGAVGIRIFLRDNASTDPADPAITEFWRQQRSAHCRLTSRVRVAWTRRDSWRREIQIRGWWSTISVCHNHTSRRPSRNRSRI